MRAPRAAATRRSVRPSPWGARPPAPGSRRPRPPSGRRTPSARRWAPATSSSPKCSSRRSRTGRRRRCCTRRPHRRRTSRHAAPSPEIELWVTQWVSYTYTTTTQAHSYKNNIIPKHNSYIFTLFILNSLVGHDETLFLSLVLRITIYIFV